MRFVVPTRENRNSIGWESDYSEHPLAYKLVWLEPLKFLQSVYPRGGLESWIPNVDTAQYIADNIQRNISFAPLFLDLDSNHAMIDCYVSRPYTIRSHEGRNRALFAYRLGVLKVPVLMHGPEQNDVYVNMPYSMRCVLNKVEIEKWRESFSRHQANVPKPSLYELDQIVAHFYNPAIIIRENPNLIPGGLAEGMASRNFNRAALRAGQKIEAEHPHYYKKLKLIEKGRKR